MRWLCNRGYGEGRCTGYSLKGEGETIQIDNYNIYELKIPSKQTEAHSVEVYGNFKYWTELVFLSDVSMNG